MTTQHAATTTILFSDLIGSTELMQRAGDEDAQRIFKAHYQVLRDAVAVNGGAEVKSLGDGLMVAFAAAADAVRCAINMQQASRRVVSGEHLAIRVGLNVGDALRDEGDFFGTPVVVARRLCDRAEAGQILCSSAVAHVLAGRQAFAFRDLGSLELKGIAGSIAACEVVYQRDEPVSLLARTPFVGRTAEVARLHERFEGATAGHGGLVMLVGEPGIGKTRTSDEFGRWVAERGGLVLRGRCFEGDWAPPYGAFAEAIEGYVRTADPQELKQTLGFGAAPIARLVPALREQLHDIPEPAPLQPDEERFRLLDAISQFLYNAAERTPILLMLDDLHWADRGTIAMMRHVVRDAPKRRLLVLGAYRDVELDRQHPLADALGALRREVEYDRILLKGLGREEVGTLLSTLAEQDVGAGLVQAISDETDGNPFFIREVLAHLIEEGKLYREDDQWKSNGTSIADLGIPEGVRQVITRRLSRLSADANKLMAAASAFNGGFNFLTLSLVSGLDEAATLDAVDEGLEAQLLRPTGQLDHYDFTHALIRHTLYGEMNPSRQVRLHRRIAEAYEARIHDDAGKAHHAAEIAYQYYRSAAIPGAERGVEYALIAAEGAERSVAWDEAANSWRVALELLGEGDARRWRLLGRLAQALAWSLQGEEAFAAAREAGDGIARTEGQMAATEYLADAAWLLTGAGFTRHGWTLAGDGLNRLEGDRGPTFARLAVLDLARRESEDPRDPGIPVATDDRREITAIARDIPDEQLQSQIFGALYVHSYRSREEALMQFHNIAAPTVFVIGDYVRGLELWNEQSETAEREGRIAFAAAAWSQVSRCHSALGDLRAAQETYERASLIIERQPGPSFQALQVIAALDELNYARDDGWGQAMSTIGQLMSQQAPENNWAAAPIRAGVARTFAVMGQIDPAMALMPQLLEPITRAPGFAINYTRMVCNAAEVLWLTGCTDAIDTIERAVRDKVVEPDFRYAGVDGRLALAGLRALQGDYDDAAEWFSRARAILEEQRARPLRAITDYYEALMYTRRAADGDADRTRPLLDAALAHFRDIGMTGWIRRAEELLQQLSPR